MKIDVTGRKIGEIWYQIINGIPHRMEYLGNGYVCQTAMR